MYTGIRTDLRLLIYLCFAYTWITMFGGQSGVEAAQSNLGISMARCRAHCLRQFTAVARKPTPEDELCVTPNCSECWNSCSWLFDRSHRVIWRGVCQNTDICLTSCRSACRFKTTMSPGRSSNGWEVHVLDKQTDLERTVLKWKLSSKSSKALKSPRADVVYIVLGRDRSRQEKSEWTLHMQTSSTYAEFKTDKLFPETEIWIRAVGENGTLASKKITVDTMYNKPVATHFPGGLNLEIDATSVNGSVLALVTWQNLQADDNASVNYELSWFRQDCNVYQDGPRCQLPADAFYNTFVAKGKKKVTKEITGLTFNTEFDFQLEATHNKRSWLEKKTIITPFCYRVNSLFQRCLQETAEPWVPEPMVSPVEGLWQLNVSEAVHDPDEDSVRVTISWTPILNHSDLLFNVTWMDRFTSAVATDSYDTKRLPIVLDLQPDSNYDITVVATYESPGGHWHFLGEKQLVVNTFMPVTQSQAVKIPSKREPIRPTQDERDGVIVGVTCIVTGIIISVIIIAIYKKRRSVKDVVIPKTAVTKSNSYKSSTGYKPDYANELLVVTDEWEVTPQQLKFSTPLGQGAFGKVVTGYCDDRKVAIKVLKDSAPLSYKEDLLAEIALMKKLGTHPNIVSLVGACTLHEPIALIMEYVPYGNLQSFLKKCRQEGEFRQRGRHRELTYSMVDSDGSMESGVITPTDILAFARQIVMAMEYLAEKKYVHRDLAARNVLLDYNKVVKVCDFGLSRDIYHDNQYKKLTGGKLPIKWMAIESLKDRVFTTQSDVWSFGILLWEIVTMGASPYPNIALSDLYYMLSSGYRMEKPSNCSDELYSIMRYSWKQNPKDRPTFTQLRHHMEDLLTRDCDYLELENIDVPLSNTDSSSLPLSDPFSTSAMAAEAEARENGRLISVSSGEEMTVDVCVHDKSTDKLLCPTDESNGGTGYRNSRQVLSEMT